MKHDRVDVLRLERLDESREAGGEGYGGVVLRGEDVAADVICTVTDQSDDSCERGGGGW